MDHLLMVLVLVWSSGKCDSTGVQCETTAEVDIVLLVDGFGSFDPTTFTTIKSFLARLVRAFDIGPDKVQIGMVRYSNVPRTEWNLNTHQSNNSLLEAIGDLQQEGGGTMTGLALDYILHNSFDANVGMRADSQKIAVLITDEESTDDPFLPSKNVKDAGIEVYAIGVNDADETELLSIVSDPDEIHMYNIVDFSLLSIVDGLTINICNGVNGLGVRAAGKNILTGVQCETTAKADIVLLVDSSSNVLFNFRTIKTFLTGIVSVFDIGPDRFQIGLVQFSDFSKTEWHLNTHQDKYSLLMAIANLELQYGDTLTGPALDYILQNNFKPSVGMRADSQKIAVLITNEESGDDVPLPLQNLKDAGIEVYVVGVNEANDLKLRWIASDPSESHVYQSSEDLLLDFINKLTINICNSANRLVFFRLVNGTDLCSGRLEVKSDQSNQSWSSVCEDDFDQQDAEVVCRELGCGAPSVLQGALYGEVEAPMWTKEFQCGGNESALLDCRSSDSDNNTCSSGKAVGLTCSEPFRLVGGSSRCTGTLEVKQRDWRPVDGSDWTLTSAVAFCRNLNCGSAVSAGRREDSSNRSAWKINFDCVHSGSALRECGTLLSWSSSTLELTCSDPAAFIIRLVVLPLILLLFNTVIYFIFKTTRGKKPGPQENIEVDYYNLSVSRTEGGSAEEEGAQAEE
ncbi:collagen alpha-1(XII) chain-like [Epinephelus fuscoguttatus]|uniref:collagen alpha-1(XII) chain-like n=1 Tax=Epinephelus fuscoguttatus TaxID=293821 RepID=UPI0020D02476|nr:collagen alpha-1(XII) chain-like [Epinephelus fuscoguttatus]